MNNQPVEQYELDLGTPEPDTTATTPTAENPTPIGLQELMALGARVEALGKAMQNPNADMRELVSLSHACGLDMHIEILPDLTTNNEQFPDPSVPAEGSADATH